MPPMTGQQALTALTAHPRTFLQKYPVRIAGSSLASGVTQYAIWYSQPSSRPGSILRTTNMHTTDAFRMSSQLGMAGPSCANFNAHSVFMEQSNVAPIALYSIAAGAGPNILVTGVLSGCSFIVNDGPNPGDIDCAHLQPNGETAQVLETRLTPLYNHVYGVSSYGHTIATLGGASRDRNVTIIGVRMANRWKIYAQKLDIMNSFAIRSVHRIYPPD
jgi:hypothetical protein